MGKTTHRSADDGACETREADDALRDAVCEADDVRRGHCEMGGRREHKKGKEIAEGGVSDLRHRSERVEEGRTVVEQDRDGRVAERAPAETDGAVSPMMFVSLYGTAIALGRDDVRAQSQGCQRTYGQTWNGTKIACLQGDIPDMRTRLPSSLSLAKTR